MIPIFMFEINIVIKFCNEMNVRHFYMKYYIIYNILHKYCNIYHIVESHFTHSASHTILDSYLYIATLKF